MKLFQIYIQYIDVYGSNLELSACLREAIITECTRAGQWPFLTHLDCDSDIRDLFTLQKTLSNGHQCKEHSRQEVTRHKCTNIIVPL